MKKKSLLFLALVIGLFSFTTLVLPEPAYGKHHKKNVLTPEEDAAAKAKQDEEKHAAEQAAIINQIVRPGLDPVPCLSGCSTPTSLDKYNDCNEKNDYFEDDIKKITNSFEFQSLKSSIPENLQLKTCIRESQSIHAGPFKVCDVQKKNLSRNFKSNRGSKHKTQRVQKACQSGNEVELLTTTYAATVDCLSSFMNESDDEVQKNILEKDMFSMISLESGFNLNAVSSTGVTGVGQLCQAAVKHVNNTSWKDMIASINSSSKSSCKAIAKMGPKRFAGDGRHRCEMISPEEGNPLNNLLYTFGYQQYVRKQVSSAISSLNKSSKGKVAFTNASESFRTKLISQVAVWGHNTGPGGIRSPLKYLMSSSQGQKLIKKEDMPGFLKALQGYVASYQRHYHARQRRVTEASSYMKNIKTRLAQINQHAGSTKGAPKCGF